MPGVYAIGDVLEQQGYNQEFLIGSNGKFAGRSSYLLGMAIIKFLIIILQ